jgi:hypothetical protein
VRDHAVEIAIRLRERLALRRNVAVVETIKRHADLLEKFEGGIHARFRNRDRIRAELPRTLNRAGTERIRARPTKRVPVRDRKTQVLRHRLPVYHLVRVVVAEGEGIRRADSFVGNATNFGEVRLGFFHEGRRS